MNEILEKRQIARDTFLFRVRAPLVARKAQAGQFVIVRISEPGERIPLTIADFDRKAGDITMVVMCVGKTTSQMSMLSAGESILDLVGPLGLPSHVERFGTVVCVGGGVGVAPVFPIARELKKAGNHVVGIIGAKSREHLIFEQQMRSVCDEVIVTTDDGSYGRKGFVTVALGDRLKAGGKADLVYAIGPVPMMKAVSELTKPLGIRTIVSLNAIMVDGTGMCGACRVSVGGRTRFSCVEGPEFDGHEVDFDELMARQSMYKEQEMLAMERYHAMVGGRPECQRK